LGPMHRKPLLRFALLTMTTLACGTPPQRAAIPTMPTPVSATAQPAAFAPVTATATALASAAPPVKDKSRPVWTAKLESEADFLHYSKESGNDRFTKFVVDLKTSAIYYVDAELYPMHKDFVFAELLKTPRTKEAEQKFDRNYGKNKPNFLMCYLVHHTKADVWSLAFWDGDKATAEHVRLAFKRMNESFYAAAKVRFRPNSNDQETVAKTLTEIPQITNSDLYQSAGYQPFAKGSAVGKLRIVPKGSAYDTLLFEPDEVVILPEPLSDITPVAGILSESFSTPLAHVNLRAAAWGIPNAGVKDASRTYAALAGKVVFLETGANDITLRLATAGEVERAKDAKRLQATVQVPKANLAAATLAPLASIRAKDASAYGSKTANLGEIVFGKLAGVAVPPGFGIPIKYYAEHLKQAGIDAHIEAMLKEFQAGATLARRKAALEALRKEIQDAPMAPSLAQQIGAAVTALKAAANQPQPDAEGARASLPGERGVFVRSSTNAEDLPGFSGAGLYDTVPNVREPDAVIAAVRRVWASVWNLAAYEERQLYQIDHRQVFGAVLIQIAVPATAAGVLITAHPTDPTDRNTFTINAKSGLGMRVVDGKKLPEIVHYNIFNKGLRIVSRSDEDTMLVFQEGGGVREVENPQKSAPILTNTRVAKLADAANKVRSLFSAERPLDIEWVLRGEDIFIVQARPYMGGPRAAPRVTP
jgi:Pyruvate phosphate dikinase, AMP/ATP-binding domain